ncbi:FAD-binding oxidoreductase [Nonomuraea sp. MG754425]|uniref:FAD-binding oxidoreductase n=1 Tax=Nonomuraea sp. MG754425 TaxID=2570319 RepID=UPI001F1BA355|nr:FAD-binding oxidoreductase [Nonomuraea sp. MG754425]MCF6471274.1 FAD-binding oxidoreductase [Nonomuraea sp. MG754425]
MTRRPTAADWTALRRRMRGEVILPGDPGYATARRIADPRFHQARPRAIARCSTEDDVRAAVDFARRHRLTPHPRSGGHSFAGYSTGPGLVIDVSPLDAIRIDDARARIGAGNRSGRVTRVLAEHGRLLPVGTCPEVGIAGLTLGGGIGMVGRAYGLTMDNLREADIVLADGSAVTCGPSAHPDLYFALRGAGAGAFGVVTALTFDTYPAPEVRTFFLGWPGHRTAETITAWQRWSMTLPEPMSTQLCVRGGASQTLVIAWWCGAPGAGDPLVARLVAALGEPAAAGTHTSGYPDAITHLWEVLRPSPEPVYTFQEDHLLAAPLPPNATALLARRLAARPDTILLLERQGGALGKDPTTAWAHRGCPFAMWFWSEVAPAAGVGRVIEARNRVVSLWQELRPWASGQSYQNNISPRRPDWAAAYYGEHLDRLRAIKTRYDPHDLFHHPQSLRPALLAARSD